LSLRAIYLANFLITKLTKYNWLMFYLQMQKPKHKKNKNKRLATIVKTVGGRKLRLKN